MACNGRALQELFSSLLTKYYTGDQIKKNEMGWASGMYGTQRGAYRVLVGRPEVNRLLGRSTHRWEDKVTTDLQIVGLGGMDWINLTGSRLLKCGNKLPSYIKCGKFLD
jgi:hypothetical protein